MALRRLLFTQGRPASAGVVRAWWQSRWLWILLALASLLPFALSPLPPLGDLFSHMGRYHVMLDGAHLGALRRYWRFEWGFVPNLGQDLLMLPMSRLFGVERGALILAALIPPAMILGFRALSVAIHGRVEPIALLALPFAYSFTFLYGFMNFHTGLVVVLWAMVLWFRADHWPGSVRIVVFTLISAVALIAHIGAWVIFLAAIGSLELARALERHRLAPWPAFFEAAPRVVPLLVPGLLLVGLANRGTPPPATGGSLPYWLKVYWLAFPLRDQNRWLDLASLALIAAAPALLLSLRRARLQSGMTLFAALLTLLFWALPLSFMNGFYGDLRLLAVIWIAVLLALRCDLTSRSAGAIAVAALLLFAVRLTATTIGWTQRGHALTADLEALNQVPRGARIAAFAPLRTCQHWSNDGLSHLASLAIVRRDAFTSSEWDLPGQNLLRPAFLPGSTYNHVTAPGVAGTCSGPTIASLLAGLPRERFDYVWLLRVKRPETGFGWLVPVYHGPDAVLYRIARPSAQAVRSGARDQRALPAAPARQRSIVGSGSAAVRARS